VSISVPNTDVVFTADVRTTVSAGSAGVLSALAAAFLRLPVRIRSDVWHLAEAALAPQCGRGALFLLFAGEGRLQLKTVGFRKE